MVDKSILKDQYDREGYAIYNDIIDKDLIGEASDHVNWLLERNPDLRPEQLHNNLMTDDPFWVRLIITNLQTKIIRLVLFILLEIQEM